MTVIHHCPSQVEQFLFEIIASAQASPQNALRSSFSRRGRSNQTLEAEYNATWGQYDELKNAKKIWIF